MQTRSTGETRAGTAGPWRTELVMGVPDRPDHREICGDGEDGTPPDDVLTPRHMLELTRSMLEPGNSGAVWAWAVSEVVEGPVGAIGDEDVWLEAAAVAQRVATWALSIHVRAITEVYRRRSEVASRLIREGGPARCRAVRADLDRRSTVADVALSCGISEFQAGARLTAGWEMARRLPELAEAFRSGQVEWSKVQSITDATSRLPDPDDAVSVCAAVLPKVRRLGFTALRRELAGAVAGLRSRGAAEAAERAARLARSRRLVTFEALADTMGQVTATLPIEDMLTVKAALDEVAHLTHHPEDTRTADQRRADAFRDVFSQVISDNFSCGPAVPGSRPVDRAAGNGAGPTHGKAFDGGRSGDEAGSGDGAGDGESRIRRSRSGRRPRAEVVVTIPLAALLGSGDEAPPVGVLLGYGPLPRGIVQDLAAGATWRCAVTDDRHGTLLGLGRKTFTPAYTPGRPLVDHVVLRDETCRFPGCRRSAATSELDHLVPHPRAATCECNLIALCPNHHRLKHEASWGVVRHTDGDTGVDRDARIRDGSGVAGRTIVTEATDDVDGTDDVHGTRDHRAGAVVPPGTLRWTSPSGATWFSHPTTLVPAFTPQRQADPVPLRYRLPEPGEEVGLHPDVLPYATETSGVAYMVMPTGESFESAGAANTAALRARRTARDEAMKRALGQKSGGRRMDSAEPEPPPF